MEMIVTFKFANPDEAACFIETLRTYPAAALSNELEQIGDGNIVLIKAVGDGAVKRILAAASGTIAAKGRYPWTKTLPKKSN